MTDTWASLPQESKDYYLAFHALIENDEPVVPQENDFIFGAQCVPSEAQLNAVQDTGEELVRTINYRLNERQRQVLLLWLEVHPEHRFRPRVEENQENENNIINDDNQENIINQENNINIINQENYNNNNNIDYPFAPIQ